MAYKRIAARRGNPVSLDVDFFQGGIGTDPFALYRIEIFRKKVVEENLVFAVDIPSPDSSEYPSPVEEIVPTGGQSDGQFRFLWDVPSDLVVPDIYFDVWYFFGSDPRTGSGDTLDDHISELDQVCNRFWVYPNQWFASGGLQSLRFGYEPLDIKFRKPELRPLELGIMPLPLYDFNFNLVAPLIPFINYSISIWTENDEILVDSEPMCVKLRQGSFRVNPYVVSYDLDTSDFFIGTYKYRVTATLPDGTTRVSQDFNLTIS